jgi:hypothetical protein
MHGWQVFDANPDSESAVFLNFLSQSCNGLKPFGKFRKALFLPRPIPDKGELTDDHMFNIRSFKKEQIV